MLELRATHKVIDLDADDEMPADLSLEQELEHMIDEAAGFHDGTLGWASIPILPCSSAP